MDMQVFEYKFHVLLDIKFKLRDWTHGYKSDLDIYFGCFKLICLC